MKNGINCIGRKTSSSTQLSITFTSALALRSAIALSIALTNKEVMKKGIGCIGNKTGDGTRDHDELTIQKLDQHLINHSNWEDGQVYLDITV